MTFKQNQHFNFVTFVFSLFILLNFQRVICRVKWLGVFKKRYWRAVNF